MKTARLINIFIVVFVDLLGFSLILPLLPYYAGKFGATPAVIGLLTASYAAASLVGAPLMGRLSAKPFWSSFKNRSGEEETISTSGNRKKLANGAGLIRRNSRYKSQADPPAKGASSRCVRQT